MDNKALELQLRIIPEMIDMLEKRYTILRTIYYNQPIGRRALSAILSLGERVVRSEITSLSEYGLVEIFPQGMVVTKEGEEIIVGLEEMIYQLKGLSQLERKLEKLLSIGKVIIVPGDIDESNLTLPNLGKAAANYLRSTLSDNVTIAVTGGSTVAQVAEEMPKTGGYKGITVTPARGGLGRNMENQANTIAAKLATKLGGSYKLLHVPDNLSKDALDRLVQDNSIKEIINTIKGTDILLYGIGKAEELARRRGMTSEEVEKITKNGAVAEAFGYYFDKSGHIVHKTITAGLDLNDYYNIRKIIAVAGGKSKAVPIISVATIKTQDVLVTDEGAAREIINIMEDRE